MSERIQELMRSYKIQQSVYIHYSLQPKNHFFLPNNPIYSSQQTLASNLAIRPISHEKYLLNFYSQIITIKRMRERIVGCMQCEAIGYIYCHIQHNITSALCGSKLRRVAYCKAEIVVNKLGAGVKTNSSFVSLIPPYEDVRMSS